MKIIKVVGEESTRMFTMSDRDAAKCKKLLLAARENDDDFPDEVNTILDHSTEIVPDDALDTSGDMWGWLE